MKKDSTTHGENGLGAKVQTQKFSIPLGIKNGIAKLQPKLKSIATVPRGLLLAPFVLSAFGMLLLLMNNTASGEACRTEKETLSSENGNGNTKES